jgi:hypothetical protein
MTTTPAVAKPPQAAITPARRLETTMAAARVSFTWFGVRKSLTTSQKAQAAEAFGAEGRYLSAAKKLLDTSCPAFRMLTSKRSQIVALWRGMSLPYPEPGLRLIRQDRIEFFNDQMAQMRQDLQEAAVELDRRLPELRQAAQQRLGDLYNPSDYPASLAGEFGVEWEFPSVQPPDYLMQLNPALYEQERQRMVGRFEEAVSLAEDAFTSELGQLVSHLAERLTPGVDGQCKTFRDSSLENIHRFFEHFRSLNVHSSRQLDDLVNTAQRLLRGVKPDQLRTDGSLREQVKTQLSAVQGTLEALMVDQPRRRIIRSAPTKAAG